MQFSKTKAISIISIILIIIGLIASSVAFFHFGPKTMIPTATTAFVIKLSDSQEDIVSKLEEQGYFRNKESFLYALNNRHIQAGTFHISPSMNVFRLSSILTSPPNEIWIQFPEGLRREEIAEIFAKKLSWTDKQVKEFLQYAKEGYLFPSTYLFKKNITPKEATERLHDEFLLQTEELFEDEAHKTETVILASLIQREAYNKNDMPIISTVIKNRLAENMRLQIDATIQYALGTEGEWWPVVKRNQYKLASPMNTYQQTGLPPSPICSPGIDAIKAAIRPASGSYMYYLHDANKVLRASNTYEEHQLYYSTYVK